MAETGIILFLFLFSHAGFATGVPALIPYPQNVEWKPNPFSLDEVVYLSYDIHRNDRVILEIRELLIRSGVNDIEETNLNFSAGKDKIIRIVLRPVPGISQYEGYQLTVFPGEITIEAKNKAGIYRGVQTLKQLVVKNKGKFQIKGCRIRDWPAFAIRGFMQDVGRNYMPVALLKEQIDVMAAYKFNVFHLHLTDNPGWRLESKIYPELKNAGTMSRWPGKYYSQEEFTGLVNYCHDRFITLVPEFDVPGHCDAFRKAFGLDSMSDPRVKPVLLDLIDELCNLVPAEKMPFIHLGTDEVWHKNERPASDLLPVLTRRIKENERELIVWRPGQSIKGDDFSVTQLWSSNGHPKPSHRYLDSRLNYLNHLDPLAGIYQLYFDRICGAAQGDSLRMGGILCCWNDNNVADPADILRQNPVYPGMLTYSEAAWTGQKTDYGENYLAKFPSPGETAYWEFKDFEKRLIAHRDLNFKGLPFPYVRQSEMAWSLIGPFDNGGDANKLFPVEEGIKTNYLVNGINYRWKGPFYGGTIHLHHFFGYPSLFAETKGTVYAATSLYSPVAQQVGCWIGFHDWSRSAGRRGGPFPPQGKWHKTNPEVWVNGREIPPPIWKNPGLPEKSDEIPFTDENYSFREPARIGLKKGWNKVLLKIPQDGTSWKWMFTFVPVENSNGGFQEVKGLKFKPTVK